MVVIDDATGAVPLGEALLAGGITSVEVTLRTDAAADAIRAMRTVPGLTVGAGTVRTVHDLRTAVDAGAQFLVSPGLDIATVRAAAACATPILPGIATASEAQAALGAGLRAVKVFPASVLGGPRFLQAIAGPFPELRFFPSGGISADDAGSYLAVAAVEGVCGSWMVDRQIVSGGDWASVTRLSRAAVNGARP